MATLSPSGSNRTRLSAAASFHYRRPRRRPDTRSGLSIHTLTTPRRSFGASSRGRANVPGACHEDGRPNAASHSQSTTYPAPTPPICARGLCAEYRIRLFVSYFLNILKVTRADRSPHAPSRFRRSLTSFRPFVSSSRASGLGVSRDRRGTGGARAADNLTVAAPWPLGP